MLTKCCAGGRKGRKSKNANQRNKKLKELNRHRLGDKQNDFTKGKQ